MFRLLVLLAHTLIKDGAARKRHEGDCEGVAETEESQERCMSQRPLKKEFRAAGMASSFKRYREVSAHLDRKVPADSGAEGCRD